VEIDLRNTKTYYINMDKHVDRNKDMVKLGEDLRIKDYSRLSGTEIVGHPKAGCATSHLEILNLMSEPTLILEDDCVIASGNMLINVPDDADAVYIGLSEWGYLDSVSKRNNFKHERNKVFKHVHKINGMLATHAILYISPEYVEMSRRVAKWSAANDEHIDQGFALIQKYFNVYALSVPTFYQHSNTKATNIKLKGK
jgi:hypothetical protein